ncbi:hypothetical protein [Aureispira anguillae]|uniref:Uncharacterized protein n=1 Tax=Aureispira anguillae TaxID=2864201 RepID=A0A915YL40_9BACT|nr:hypothetical protein [Aureispira anguillae]BDS15215.1 hypothetical protein AsAng_0059990 [Aureispira anguillae]
MIKFVFDLIDTEYELCEKYEDDDLEKKEKIKEKKGKEDKFYNPNLIFAHQETSTPLFNTRLFIHPNTHNYCLNFKLEVPSPPPEWV